MRCYLKKSTRDIALGKIRGENRLLTEIQSFVIWIGKAKNVKSVTPYRIMPGRRQKSSRGKLPTQREYTSRFDGHTAKVTCCVGELKQVLLVKFR